MDKDMAETAKEHGISAASTIDSLIWEKVAEGGIGLRADANADESGERAIAADSTVTRIKFNAMTGLEDTDTGVVAFYQARTTDK